MRKKIKLYLKHVILNLVNPRKKHLLHQKMMLTYNQSGVLATYYNRFELKRSIIKRGEMPKHINAWSLVEFERLHRGAVRKHERNKLGTSYFQALSTKKRLFKFVISQLKKFS